MPLASSYLSRRCRPLLLRTTPSRYVHYTVKLLIQAGSPIGAFFKHHCTSSTRSSFFSERVVDIWNSLSSHHTDFSSLPRFKRCINSMDFSDYLQFVWLQILFRILICVCYLVLCSSLISGQLSVLCLAVLLYCSCCCTFSLLVYWANKWWCGCGCGWCGWWWWWWWAGSTKDANTTQVSTWCQRMTLLVASSYYS